MLAPHVCLRRSTFEFFFHSARKFATVYSLWHTPRWALKEPVRKRLSTFLQHQRECKMRISSSSSSSYSIDTPTANHPVEADGLMVICMLWRSAFYQGARSPRGRWKFSIFFSAIFSLLRGGSDGEKLLVIYYARWGPRVILSERRRSFIFNHIKKYRGAIQ